MESLSSTEPRAWLKDPVFWIFILVAIAAPLAMLTHLGALPFWVDESIAVLPAYQIQQDGLPKNVYDMDFLPWQLKYNLWDPATPLYRYCVALFTWLPGFSELTARLFSVLMGLLVVVPLFPLVRRVYGLQTAYVTVALFLSSPALLYHAREARHFTFVMFLGAASLYFLHRASQRPGSWAVGLWFVFFVSALLAQTLGYALIPVAGLFVILNGPRKFFSWRFWPIYLVFSGIYLAVLALFGSTLPFFNHTGCDSHISGCHPNPFFYLVYLSELLAPTTQMRLAAPPLTVFSLNHLLFPIGIALTILWARRGRLTRADWSLMLLWFFVPLILLSTRELKFPRYLFIWAMPGVAFFTAVGLVWVVRRFVPEKARGWATAVLALVLILAPQVDLRLRDARQGLWRYLKSDILDAPTDNFEKIRWQTEQLNAQLQTDDVVISSFDDASLSYYLKRQVFGFVCSRRTDRFFNRLLDTAEREGHRVFFVNSLPALDFCTRGPKDPRDISCLEKYAHFYSRCTDGDQRSPACVHLRVGPIR